MVDSKLRTEWEEAFQDREERCEELGAIHLLSHGIWAFKVTGAGAATDLVYREPLVPGSDPLQRMARALILTEWKKVTDGTTVERESAIAITQARLYGGGILGDVELKLTRYIVLVSLKHVEPPPDIEFGGINYRHIVIPISSERPSQIARRQRAKA